MSTKTKNRIFMSQVIIGFAVVMMFLSLVIIIGFDANSDSLKTGLIFIGIGVILLVIGIFAYKRYKVIGQQEKKDGKLNVDDDDYDKLN